MSEQTPSALSREQVEAHCEVAEVSLSPKAVHDSLVKILATDAAQRATIAQQAQEIERLHKEVNKYAWLCSKAQDERFVAQQQLAAMTTERDEWQKAAQQYNGVDINTEGAPMTDDITTGILEDRGKKYGLFAAHAEITQELKRAMQARIGWRRLADDQVEALDMIAHKIGRILNGDPNYVDSWDDIAGYARLVADRLRGVVR